MIVSDLTLAECAHRLAADGLRFVCGPFCMRLRMPVPDLVPILHDLYAHYPINNHSGIDDYRMTLQWASPLRRWVRPVVRFTADGSAPFTDVPINRALANLEWGTNWCIATRAHHFLMLHAAVVARNQHALILPAAPSNGKSTLCAALVHSGWRLFSDEFGLMRPEDGAMVPIPRLISLKNQSIEVIRAFSSTVHFGPIIEGTHKGTVAHVRPPFTDITHANEIAYPRWLVFPRWQANAPLTFNSITKDQAFILMATNAFNYEVLGEQAFKVVAKTIHQCESYSLVYSDLKQAVCALDELTCTTHD